MGIADTPQELAEAKLPEGFVLSEVGELDAQGGFEFTATVEARETPGTVEHYLSGQLDTQAGDWDTAMMKARTYDALYGYRETVSNNRYRANHTEWMRSRGISLSNWDLKGSVTFYCNLFRTSCREVKAWVEWGMTDRLSVVYASWDFRLSPQAMTVRVAQFDKAGYGTAKVMFGNNDAVFLYHNAYYWAGRGIMPSVAPKYLKGLTRSEKQANLVKVFGASLSTTTVIQTLGICIAPKPGEKIKDPGSMRCPYNPGDVDPAGCPNCTEEISRYNKINGALFDIENERIPALNASGGTTAGAAVSCAVTVAGVITASAAPVTCGAFFLSLGDLTTRAVTLDLQRWNYEKKLSPARAVMNSCIARMNTCKAPGFTEPRYEIVFDAPES